MSTIKKVKVDGIVYDIGADYGNIYNAPNVDAKQDTLVSGQNIRTINNQSILGEGNINIEEGSGTVAKTKVDAPISSLGNTPYTYSSSENAQAVKLVSDVSTTYEISSDTVGEMSSATVSTSASVHRDNSITDYYKYNVDSGISWASNYVNITFSGLEIGASYKCIVSTKDVSQMSGFTGNFARIYLGDASSGVYKTLTVLEDTLVMNAFTAEATTQRFRIYFNGRATSQEGDYYCIKDVYLNKSTADNDKHPIQHVTGSFVGEVVLPDLVDGAKITSSPTCTVKKISAIDIQASLDAKQNTLVSGTNIKTVNGESILASGDIIVPAVDTTLAVSGGAADAAVTGIALANKVDVPIVDAGQTPFTYEYSETVKNIRLESDEETTYKGSTNTIAAVSDESTRTMSTSSSVHRDTSVTDYYKFNVDADKSWSKNYVKVTFSGLEIGQSYKIIVLLTGSTQMSEFTGNFARIYIPDTTGSYKSLAVTDSYVASNTFTAAAETQQCMVYFNGHSTSQQGDFFAFTDIYVNKASAGNTKDTIQNLSGTFTGVVDLPELVNGIVITSSPSCDVKKVMNADVIMSINGNLPGGDGNINISTKDFVGKTIVNFGDSIFGMRRPPNDISTRLAQLTGATVYNAGFGGCRMSQHTYANRPTLGQFSMFKLADAIATGDWSGQDAAVTNPEWTEMPSYFPATEAMLKTIDFSKVDIITIAYGTNDFTAGVVMEDDQDLDSITTVAGALRYSIETILTAFPNIRIFVLSPIYRFWMDSSDVFTYDSNTYQNAQNDKLTDYVTKFKSVAEEYNLPFIDNYNIGLGKFTRSIYYPASDGTHPTSKGTKLIAEHIFNELF